METSALTNFVHVPLIAILTLSGSALGQRGLTEHSSAENNSPLYGIQGFFDTEMTTPGKLVFDFPSFQVEYGINERWSVGLNGLLGLAGFGDLSLKSTPTLGLKARHSIYSAHSLRFTLSGYFFQIPVSNNPTLLGADNSGIFRFTAANLNLSKSLESNEFGLSSLYSWLSTSLQTPQKINDSKEDVQSWSTALWWRWYPNKQFGTELLGLVTPLQTQSQDSAFVESKQTAVSFSNPSFVRAMVNWRPSARWLWSLGAATLPTQSREVVPYLGFVLTFPQYEPDDVEGEIQ